MASFLFLVSGLFILFLWAIYGVGRYWWPYVLAYIAYRLWRKRK